MMEPDQALRYERARRDFLKEIEPFLKLKTEIYSITLPRITVYRDGRVETQYLFSERQREILDMCDEMIEAIRVRYEPPTSPARPPRPPSADRSARR